MTEFFTSDHHFGHENVIRYCKRPFADAATMGEAMMLAWNTEVMPDDVVWYLGDFSLSLRALPIVRQLNGVKHLIAGNHDKCHPACWKNAVKGEAMRHLYLDAGFASVATSAVIQRDGVSLLLHHMPYASADHTDQRHEKWRPVDKGGWLLHGHVHEKWRERGRMINVGVDVWDFKPVRLETLLAMTRTRVLTDK